MMRTAWKASMCSHNYVSQHFHKVVTDIILALWARTQRHREVKLVNFGIGMQSSTSNCKIHTHDYNTYILIQRKILNSIIHQTIRTDVEGESWDDLKSHSCTGMSGQVGQRLPWSPVLTITPLPCSLGVGDLPSCPPPRVRWALPLWVWRTYTHSTPSPAKFISNRPWDGAGAHRPHYPASPEIRFGAIWVPTPEILELGVRD